MTTSCVGDRGTMILLGPQVNLEVDRALRDSVSIWKDRGNDAYQGAIRQCERQMLLEHDGLTPGIRRCFVVYLASQNRTLHGVLFPTPKDIRLAYEGSFAGMTREAVTLDRLLDCRRRLFDELPVALDKTEREFLRSVEWAITMWWNE